MSSGLTSDLVLRLIDSGETQSAIARDFGVSRQYVSKLAKQGGHQNPFQVMNDNLPWEVPADYIDNTIWKNVRRHGIYMTTGKLSDNDLVQVRSLYRKLQGFNVVVDFDPSYPAIPGFSNTPGFAFLPRTEDDEDFIIRRKGARLTPIGARIWRMPQVLP